MGIELCPRELHYYNTDKYPACPFCTSEGASVSTSLAAVAGGPVPSPVISVEPAAAGRAAAAGPGTALAPLDPPVGWLVSLDGPVRGEDITLRSGVNYVAATPRREIAVGFDSEAQRQSNAIVTYDESANCFQLAPGAARAQVYRNGKPVSSPTPLERGDTISIGSATVLFMPLVGERFRWA
jgi:hypothetical protein